MKMLRLVLVAPLCAATLALAAPADEMAGTWECRQPGVEYRNKPPILHVASAPGAEVSIEVDGFGREIYGKSEVTADQGGWWKVKPTQGQEFMIRSDAGSKRTPAMALRWADTKSDYRCLRLPGFAAPMPAGGGGAAPVLQQGPAVVEPKAGAEAGTAPTEATPQPSEGADKKQ